MVEATYAALWETNSSTRRTRWCGPCQLFFILVNEVNIQGKKTLKESKFDQNHHFESFKAITLSYKRILRVYNTTSSRNTRDRLYLNCIFSVIIHRIILFMILIHISFSLLLMFLFFSKSISIYIYIYIYRE